jgi:hypothetical protein
MISSKSRDSSSIFMFLGIPDEYMEQMDCGMVASDLGKFFGC